MQKLIILLIFFIPSFRVLLAQNPDSVIVLTDQAEVLPIGTQVYLLEDKEAKLSIEDILKPAHQASFKKSEAKIPNFKTTKSKIWVKFTVSNQIEEKIYLEVGTALAWYIDFYKPDGEGKYVLATQTGMMRPIKNREVDNNFFLFELAESPAPQTYYFSLQSDMVAAIPLLLGTAVSLYEYRYPYIVFFGMFWGLVIVMFVYNLFIYFSVRDKIYLYYCGYLLMALFHVNFVSGNYAYRWNIISYFSNYLNPFSFLQAFFIVLYIYYVMKVKKRGLFFKMNIGYLFLLFLFACTNIITGRYVQFKEVSDFFITLHVLYVFLYSLSEYRRGNTAARFIVFGFSFYQLGLVVVILQASGILFPINFFTRNALVLGSSLEIVLFSLALADRINLMRKEQIATQATLLVQTEANKKMVEEQNTILEKTVTQKTKDLQIAYKEIQLNNKVLEQQKEHLEISNVQVRQAKEEIQAQAELLQELMQTKQLLVGAIVHDLKTPITNIIQTSKEEKVLQTAGQMQNMVLNILEIEKFEDLKMVLYAQESDLQKMIESAIQQIAFMAEKKNIEIEKFLGGTPLGGNKRYIVKCDAALIERVIVNLLSNAIKYTENNGKITIKIKEDTQQGNFAAIEVSDNGQGIPQEYLPHIFDKFFQVNPQNAASHRSSGLGLTFCKMAVEAHGGRISAESEVGKGTTILFSLPLVEIRKNENERVIFTEKIEKIQFSSEDMAYLQPFTETLQNIDIAEYSALKKVLKEINEQKSEAIKVWKENLANTIRTSNEIEFKKLISNDIYS